MQVTAAAARTKRTQVKFEKHTEQHSTSVSYETSPADVPALLVLFFQYYNRGPLPWLGHGRPFSMFGTAPTLVALFQVSHPSLETPGPPGNLSETPRDTPQKHRAAKTNWQTRQTRPVQPRRDKTKTRQARLYQTRPAQKEEEQEKEGGWF